MRTLAYTFLLLCGGFFGLPNCFAQEMTTIQRYIDENNFERNPGAADFVFLRCSAIFGLVGAHFRAFPDLQKEAEVYAEGGKTFLAMTGAEASAPSTQKYVLGQVQRMLEGYKERWLRSKALTGNFSDDPVIRSDMQLCSALLKK